MLITDQPEQRTAQPRQPAVTGAVPRVVFDATPELRPPLRTVLGGILLCVVTVLFGAEGALIAEYLKASEYEAITEVEFRDPAVLNETVAITLESPAMWHPVAVREGITDKEFQKHYDARVTGGTQIIRVSFVDEDPARAIRIVDDIVSGYVDEFSTPDTSLADSVIETRLADLRALEESLASSLEARVGLSTARQIDLQDQLVRVQRQINEASILLAGREAEENRRRLTDPRVVTPGFILEEPVTPNPIQAVVFGGAAGGLIGVVGVYLAFHRAVTVPPALASPRPRRRGGPTPDHADRLVVRSYQTRSSGRSWQWGLKRAIDIVVSAVVLVVLSPLLVIVAALIRLTSSGPAIFRQYRVGQFDRRFEILKFRTMVVDADNSQHRANVVAQLNDAPTMLEGGTFKHNDPRVTGVGRVLRRLSIDELPQLWNVLRGDMSLVGPRPALDWEHSMFDDRYRVRTVALPGCTGLWQVSGRSRLSTRDMLEFDLEYINNWSLRRDLGILLSTPLVMLRGDGAR